LPNGELKVRLIRCFKKIIVSCFSPARASGTKANNGPLPFVVTEEGRQK